MLAAIVAVSQALVLPNGQVVTAGGVVSPLGIGHLGVAKVATPVLAKTIVGDDYDANPQYSYSYDINVSHHLPIHKHRPSVNLL